MSIKSILKDPRKISVIAIAIIFLALIRCVSEPFRLQYYSTKTLTFEDINPFLIGALVTSLALLLMIIFFLYRKYKIIIGTCILTIVVLLIIKGIFMV
jgi:hypothetical protein